MSYFLKWIDKENEKEPIKAGDLSYEWTIIHLNNVKKQKFSDRETSPKRIVESRIKVS